MAARPAQTATPVSSQLTHWLRGPPREPGSPQPKRPSLPAAAPAPSITKGAQEHRERELDPATPLFLLPGTSRGSIDTGALLGAPPAPRPCSPQGREIRAREGALSPEYSAPAPSEPSEDVWGCGLGCSGGGADVPRRMGGAAGGRWGWDYSPLPSQLLGAFPSLICWDELLKLPPAALCQHFQDKGGCGFPEKPIPITCCWPLGTCPCPPGPPLPPHLPPRHSAHHRPVPPSLPAISPPLTELPAAPHIHSSLIFTVHQHGGEKTTFFSFFFFFGP